MFLQSIHSLVLPENKFTLSSLPLVSADYFASYISETFERTRRKLPETPTPTSPHLPAAELASSLPPCLLPQKNALCVHLDRIPPPAQAHPSRLRLLFPASSIFTQLGHSHDWIISTQRHYYFFYNYLFLLFHPPTTSSDLLKYWSDRLHISLWVLTMAFPNLLCGYSSLSNPHSLLSSFLSNMPGILLLSGICTGFPLPRTLSLDTHMTYSLTNI